MRLSTLLLALTQLSLSTSISARSALPDTDDVGETINATELTTSPNDANVLGNRACCQKHLLQYSPAIALVHDPVFIHPGI
ncbi:MAG: hypothetical protein Q9169_008083 [Polycauliona sp. 2 TL-2023]